MEVDGAASDSSELKARSKWVEEPEATPKLGHSWRNLLYALRRQLNGKDTVFAVWPVLIAVAAVSFPLRVKHSALVFMALTALLASVLFHILLLVQGRRQAAAYIASAGLLTFQALRLCEAVVMDAEGLSRNLKIAESSQGLLALGFFAGGGLVGSQPISRLLRTGIIMTSVSLEGLSRWLAATSTANYRAPVVLFFAASLSLVLGALVTGDREALVGGATTSRGSCKRRITAVLVAIITYLVVAPEVVQWELQTGTFVLSGVV